ncbi:MAG TPA: nuclear transport factor 2 family protein [Actinomycetota bacterium]|nr:nuclear transport factor 2 family protein [Actinomycetota bacterium]
MHPNEELLRREYEAFAGQDLAALDEIFADDIVYHVPGNNPFSGDYHGKASVFRLFREDRRASFRSEIHDVLANDRHAVALTFVYGARGDRMLEDVTVHVVHVLGGKITEAWFFPGDQAASDEFWS